MHTQSLRPVADRFTSLAQSEARAEQLRDSESLANWLLENSSAATSAWQPVMKDKTAEDFTGWSVGDLTALAFDFGQPYMTRCAALDVLADRYCATAPVAALIVERSESLALLMAEDAREAA